MRNNIYHDTICFDVDSTLVTIEGLDWIAKQKGVEKEVKKLTDQSMDGTVPLEKVFQKELDLLAPSQTDLKTLGEQYLQSLTNDAKKVIQALQLLKKDIWLVTGNFALAVKPLADYLLIPEDHIHTNRISFNDSGEYLSIDPSFPLAKEQGKGLVIQDLGKDRTIAFIGDSVTDLATKPYVLTFIGFGGVVSREKVKEQADYFVDSKSLMAILPLVLTKKELQELELYN